MKMKNLILNLCIALGLLMANGLEAQTPGKIFRPSPWGWPVDYGSCLADCFIEDASCRNYADMEYYRNASACYREFWDLKQCCDEYRDCCEHRDHPYDVYWWCMLGHEYAHQQAIFNCTIFFYVCLSDCESTVFCPWCWSIQHILNQLCHDSPAKPSHSETGTVIDHWTKRRFFTSAFR